MTAHEHIDQMANRANAEIRKLTAQKWLELVLKIQAWNRSDAQQARRRREKEMQ